MFHRILVAVDQTPSSAEVVEAAIVLAKAMKSRLMLVHVLSSEEKSYLKMSNFTPQQCYPVGNQLGEEYQRQWEDYEQKGLELLQTYTAKATAVGVHTVFAQNAGNVGHVICEMAQNWEANLIVIGHRGYYGLQEFILGSASNYVLHHAHCSVITVPHLSEDDSDRAETQLVSLLA